MSKEVKITILDRDDQVHVVTIPTDMQLNLMEVCKAESLPVEGTCGGMALCSTCHIYIESDHILDEQSMDEEGVLDQAFFVDDDKSRLACQIKVDESLHGLVVRLAPQSL